MSPPLIAGAIWVLLSSVVALMPMRYQYKPGVTLLILAPFILIWIGYGHGWWITAIAVLAFVSMFRYPLRYIYRKLRGLEPQVPK